MGNKSLAENLESFSNFIDKFIKTQSRNSKVTKDAEFLFLST
jgi:hypothetical protein